MQVDQDNEREMDAAGENSPHLSEQEQEQASGHAAPGPLVIHELVREQGVRELDRSFGGLALSGLAAGLSIGFSFVLQSYLQAALPDAPWARLVDSFGYCLGFLIVVLGQQQLFTETTLTALIPTLTQRTPAALLATMRVWGIVLVANLVGTWLFGTVAAQHGVFPVDTYAAMSKLSAHVMSQSFGETMLLAGAAGWLIGLMVWLLPGSGPARPMIIILLTYAVAVCQFPHIIAGSCEAWFGVASGQAGVGDYVVRFLLPTLIGNTIGGTALAALLNHAPIASELNRSGAERSK
jgi:formate/nitrite transporter FocA (FNT family)